MTIVIDISTECDLFYHRNNAFCIQNNKPPMSQQQANMLIWRLLQDCINEQMLWCPTSKHFENTLEEMHPWYGYALPDALSQNYYTDVIDVTWIRVSQIVELFIPNKTYFQWVASRVGMTVLLTKGRDYRIEQWHDLVNRGKIKPPRR